MNQAWHRTAVNGKIVSYWLRKYDSWSRKIEKRLETEDLSEEEKAKLESELDKYIGKICFASQTLISIQKQRLAEREFDEWVIALEDAKKGNNAIEYSSSR